jgi:hypothetical protein
MPGGAQKCKIWLRAIYLTPLAAIWNVLMLHFWMAVSRFLWRHRQMPGPPCHAIDLIYRIATRDAFRNFVLPPGAYFTHFHLKFLPSRVLRWYISQGSNLSISASAYLSYSPFWELHYAFIIYWDWCYAFCIFSILIWCEPTALPKYFRFDYHV